MTNRRELLKAGVAASALPLTAPALALAANGGESSVESVPLYKVLYDTRFSASEEFGQRARAHGHSVVAIRGDMTRFWYHDLYHRWRRGPIAIAGCTAAGALFCLEQLAWAERMRVVLRAAHSQTADGAVAHTIDGPTSSLQGALAAARTARWGSAMADVVVQCPRRCAARRIVRTTTVLPAAEAASETLFSWVIAPIERAGAVLS